MQIVRKDISGTLFAFEKFRNILIMPMYHGKLKNKKFDDVEASDISLGVMQYCMKHRHNILVVSSDNAKFVYNPSNIDIQEIAEDEKFLKFLDDNYKNLIK